MNVLVLNSGSSSIKYRLFDVARGEELGRGVVERIGEVVPDHESGLAIVVRSLRDAGRLADLRDLHAIGHRVVHGGEAFRAPARIDAAAIDAIRRLGPLAPLHNPANLLGIEVALRLAPEVPNVAVFDTAFHQTMPPRAWRYAVPAEWYEKWGVRRYGFHGTSHAFVARRAARHLGRPIEETCLVTLHLGNGASAAAVRGGRCIDTSMGMTPLEGLVMGTRCGDLDPAVAGHVARMSGASAADVEHALIRRSGLLGMCGANDMREVHRLAARGDERAALALDVFCYRARKYVGAYAAAMGRLDAVVFTAGIGENDPEVRARIGEGLEVLGVRIDPARNAAASGDVADVSADGAAARALVVRTNEELEIAEQTVACLERP